MIKKEVIPLFHPVERRTGWFFLSDPEWKLTLPMQLPVYLHALTQSPSQVPVRSEFINSVPHNQAVQASMGCGCGGGGGGGAEPVLVVTYPQICLRSTWTGANLWNNIHYTTKAWRLPQDRVNAGITNSFSKTNRWECMSSDSPPSDLEPMPQACTPKGPYGGKVTSPVANQPILAWSLCNNTATKDFKDSLLQHIR